MTIPDPSEASQAAGTLRRSLGLYAVLNISIGAMIGSGIFVLPCLAFKIAGPLVVLAFFLAGVVVLPAALSKAEMATAMPEAGGTYLYIDRAMGPLMGTMEAPVGAESAYCTLTFTASSGQDFSANLDDLILRPGALMFTDGFESGDVSAWSASVP